MKIPFLLNEANSPQLHLERSIWTGRTKVFVDEQPVAKEPRQGFFDTSQVFRVPMPDGTERRLVLKNRFYDLVPAAYADGEELHLAKPLKSWEYALACLPILFLFAGGAIGGLFGALATLLNLRIMRSERPTVSRVLLCLGSTLLCGLVVTVLAGIAYQAIVG